MADFEVLSCCVSKDRLISGSVDGKINVWNRKSKELLYCLQDLGKQIVSLHCYLGEKKHLKHMEKIEKKNFPTAAIENDVNILASASGHNVKLWDLRTGENTFVLCSHADDVICCYFSKSLLCTASKDSCIKIWKNNKVTKNFP